MSRLFVWFMFFFFSSRRRHTRSLCDWSSDVCSSDLEPAVAVREQRRGQRDHHPHPDGDGGQLDVLHQPGGEARAEVVHEPGPAELPVLRDARLAAAPAEPRDDRARGRGWAATEGQEHAHGAGACCSGACGSGPRDSGPSMAAILSRLTQPMTAPSWPVTVTRV